MWDSFGFLIQANYELHAFNGLLHVSFISEFSQEKYTPQIILNLSEHLYTDTSYVNNTTGREYVTSSLNFFALSPRS